ncbi:MAG: glycosyl hydrolase [Bacteroidota bacterium]
MKRYLVACLLVMAIFPLNAQRKKKTEVVAKPPLDSLYQGLKWRNIGPFRGGRSVAVAGVVQDPLTYYMGTTGGGMWKTEDAGISWKNISDGQLKTGSVGAIGICESDPNVIYVGMGEHAVRGVMTSAGDGVYKSTDAGKTWTHVGLDRTRHISDVIVHPTNPDVVYVSAQGAVHGRTTDRGIYKSVDGGKTWQKTLYIDDKTGASGLTMDMTNPRILYASMWQHIRYPWTVESGGAGSGIYKSLDAGETWEKLTEGLPEVIGKSGVSVSRAMPERVFAVIEAEGEEGGVYRSDDGGKKWTQTSNNRVTIARSWYYMEIFADPQNAETVYVLNAPVLRSIDGGRSFTPIPVPHGDNHDLWINPTNNKNMINANDGGSNVTFNYGRSWSSQRNQPTAQFYRVIADEQFPYYVYGGQQDNSAIAIASRNGESGIGWKDWYSVAGCESAYLAFDPKTPDRVIGGCYQGIIEVWDKATATGKTVNAYPEIGLGSLPKDQKYRFNWNAPIFTSPHNRDVVYHAGNKLLKSANEGYTWEEVSPDLTRNDTAKHGAGGGPFTNEGAGGENYNTILYAVESPHEQGTIWVGSDDGLVHLTRDAGDNWSNVTPSGLPESMINSIEVSPHDPGTAYISVSRYKFNDFAPMAYKTSNYGASWTPINSGIAEESFIRVIREDSKTKGLLYAGTETGIYISFNDGASWQPFQSNLPVVAINDLTIRDNDLIAATAGRSFWILDDLGALQQSGGTFTSDTVTLFQPKDTYRFVGGGGPEPPANMGQNPANGVLIDYFLAEKLDSTVLTLKVIDGNGDVIRTISNQKNEKQRSWPGGPPPPAVLPTEKGLNRFAWDFRRDYIPHVDDVFVFGDYRGHMVAPGDYRLRMVLTADSVETTVKVLADPRLNRSASDYMAQQSLLREIEATVIDIHESVNDMRSAKKQIQSFQQLLENLEGMQDLADSGQSTIDQINQWESNLIQAKQKTFQDVINFPNQLNAELLSLKNRIDSHDPVPTDGEKERLQDLLSDWEVFTRERDEVIKEKMVELNQSFREKDVPHIIVKEKEKTGS